MPKLIPLGYHFEKDYSIIAKEFFESKNRDNIVTKSDWVYNTLIIEIESGRFKLFLNKICKTLDSPISLLLQFNPISRKKEYNTNFFLELSCFNNKLASVSK